MYKYRIKEQGDETLNQFHDQRIMAFDSIEARLEDIKKLLQMVSIKKGLQSKQEVEVPISK